MDNRIWIGVGVAVGIYILFRILSMNDEVQAPIDKEIETIINSEKYKAKGQYD